MTIDPGGPGTGPVRAGADWLGLREPADAAARARDLVEEVRVGPAQPADRVVIHDLGCGTGSMARWLAGQLPGPQHWVMYDRDGELLDLAAANPPGAASDGAPVTFETRRRDVTRLEPEELAGASLITASALLDMLTAEELERLVAACAAARCPVLIALSVTGHVEITPPDPFDREVEEAFNAHQRRDTAGGRLLGPRRSAPPWPASPASASTSWSARAPGASAPVRPSWRRSGSRLAGRGLRAAT